MVKVAFERQLSGNIQMVAYSEDRSLGQTDPSCRPTTKIDLKASTGKSIHDVGETSILSKAVG